MNTKFYGLLTLFIVLIAHASFAQKKVISGTVSDQTYSIPGVSILIKNTDNGTETDFDGKYSISAAVGDVLIFSYLGYKTQEIKVESQNILNIYLVQDSNTLEEIVIVAYGESSKEALTGAVTQIKAKDIANRPITNVASAIEGASAGVVAAAGGQPGSTQEIRIRGFGSFGLSNRPLYVIDGIPTSANLNNINPSDIESISILKDAASTALYGNKAANGVVLVTTKKGKNKKGKFSLNTSTATISRNIKEYDRISTNQYYPIMWEALRNVFAIPGVNTDAELQNANNIASSAGRSGIFSQLGNNPYNVPNDQIIDSNGNLNPNASLLYDDFDWEGALTKIGIRNNTDINYSGSTNKMDYYASLGYLNEEGFILNSDFERYSGRANINGKIKDWLKLGTNAAVTVSKSNQGDIGNSTSFRNPFGFTRGIAPIYPVFLHDPVTGDFTLDDNGNRVFNTGARPRSGGRNIILERNRDKNIAERTTINFKTYAEILLTNNLNFRTNISYEDENFYNSIFRNEIAGDGAPNGLATKRYIRTKQIAFNQLLNYSKSFNNHNLDILLGHESQEFNLNNLNGTKRNQTAENNIELINFVETTNLESFFDVRTEESYFSRINYNYNNKYYLSTSFRRDGSSIFSPENKWGNFWSVGGTWSMDKEKIIKKIKWINLLKLRSSLGQTGNIQGLNSFASRDLFELGNNNQDAPGILRASFAPENFSWETKTTYDVALEFGLLKNRLNGVIEYYNQKSSDLIFNVPEALSNGFIQNQSNDLPFTLQNTGTVINKGFEISLSYDIIKNKNWNWNFSINGATLKNEVTKLPQEEIIEGTKKLTVGRSFFDYWIRDWYGVDPTDGSGLFVADEEFIPTEGESDDDIRIINGTAVTPDISKAKFHYAGNVIPDLAGSFTSTANYKNFSLKTLFVYQIGGKNLDFNYASLLSSGRFGSAKHIDILNRWQKPGDITNIPRLDARFEDDWNTTSDRFLTDASFLNLRQITLNYKVSNSVLKSLDLADFNVFVNAENLIHVNAARKGFNFQQNFSGNTSNVYTAPKIISLGVNIKL